MLTLYHYLLLPCAEKTRLALAETKLPCRDELMDVAAKIDRSGESPKLNPRGLIPTAVPGDEAIIEPAVILDYPKKTFRRKFDGIDFWFTQCCARLARCMPVKSQLSEIRTQEIRSSGSETLNSASTIMQTG